MRQSARARNSTCRVHLSFELPVDMSFGTTMQFRMLTWEAIVKNEGKRVPKSAEEFRGTIVWSNIFPLRQIISEEAQN